MEDTEKGVSKETVGGKKREIRKRNTWEKMDRGRREREG